MTLKQKRNGIVLLIVIVCLILLAVLNAIDGKSPILQVFGKINENSHTEAQRDDREVSQVGLIHRDPRSFEGYTLIASVNSTSAYLIDNDGRIVNEWKSEYPGFSAYLLPNGHLLRTSIADTSVNRRFLAGGATGRVQELTWDGTVVWDFTYCNEDHVLHHGIELLPNGHILMIAWERKDAEEAVKAGRPLLVNGNEDIWSDCIIEVKPTGKSSGEIVWEWHVWDHLIQDYDANCENYGVLTSHPERINVNPMGWEEQLAPDNIENLRALGYIGGSSHTQPDKSNIDWTHLNAVSYNAEFDQIAISAPGFHEIWIIDHGTTTTEAAGHSGGKRGKGGDLLYRWGNSIAYGVGTEEDQQLFAQHDVQWIPKGRKGAGNLLVFNNGRGRWDGEYSTVIEIEAPVDENGNYTATQGLPFDPVKPRWIYATQDKMDFYASFLSGAQRLPNGNTLFCNGTSGVLFEVTESGEIVWNYIVPNDRGESVSSTTQGYRMGIFTVRRYGRDFPGLIDKDLTPSNTLEERLALS